MKKCIILLIVPFIICGCSINSSSKKIDKEFSYREHLMEFDSDDELGTKYWKRNGYKNSDDTFFSKWNKNNASISTNEGLSTLNLSLSDIKNKNDTVSYGAEIVSYSGFLYGYFGTRMKPFKRSGTVQSFFTYNGPGQSGEETKWDEIDIEFLGKDTTKVQFNYYDNGVGGHEYSYDLGFDASENFHDYGFIWEENLITWFVDFIPVYQVKISLDQWGFVMMNVWGVNNDSATAKSWAGEYQASETTSTVFYDYVIAKEFTSSQE